MATVVIAAVAIKPAMRRGLTYRTSDIADLPDFAQLTTISPEAAQLLRGISKFFFRALKIRVELQICATAALCGELCGHQAVS
jgi:hypothetical protein